MELVMNFVSNNPGWTFIFIITFFLGVTEIIKAFRNK